VNNVLIHIGYHKTGTTWLQNELFVSGNSTFHPLSKNGHEVCSLAEHFIHDENRYLLNSFDSNEVVIKRELALLKEDYLSGDNPCFVMSHERLSGNPHSSGFDGSIIAKRIKNIFPNGKILIVIREQRSFILSNYFQYLSSGGNHGIEKYLTLKYDGKRPGFSPNHIDYYPLITHYRELFGKENILILPYELFKKDGSAFISTLSRFVGKKIVVDEARFNTYWNKKEAPFLNYRLRCLNLLKTSSSLNNYSILSNSTSRGFAKLITSLLTPLIPDQFNKNVRKTLSASIDKSIIGRFEESNKRVAELIKMDLKEYGYY